MHPQLIEFPSQREQSAVMPTRDGFLLSKGELIELTGTKQSARQRRWLEKHGWPYLDPVGRSGYPRVSREVLRVKMSSTQETKTSSLPNFGALDRLRNIG